MTDFSIRASSLSELMDCPARWAAKHIDRLSTPSSGASHLGTSLHKGTGLFDQARIEQSPIELQDAVDAFVDAVKKPEREVAWTDMTPGEAIDVGVQLTLAYCRDLAPSIEFSAVELTCDPLTLNMDNGVRLTLTGQADRVRIAADGKRGIADLKSGKRIIKDGEVDLDKHVAQLGTYELIEVLVKKTTGEDMLADAQVIALPTSGRPTPKVATIRRPSRVLLGDAEHPGLLDVASQMLKSGTFFGNTRSQLCSEKYCPAFKTCWWRASGA